MKPAAGRIRALLYLDDTRCLFQSVAGCALPGWQITPVAAVAAVAAMLLGRATNRASTGEDVSR